MKRVLTNYASSAYEPYQRINRLTGLAQGFDECLSFGPEDIDAAFRERNAGILEAETGNGFWLWTPFFVARALDSLSDGDILCYADAATQFVNLIDPLLAAIDSLDSDLLILGEGFLERQYCKRDAFLLMDADERRFSDTAQRFASVFLLRASDWSRGLCARYLHYAQDPRILTDQANRCGLPNYPDFIAHRHDQAIFSLLSKREGVPCPELNLIAPGLAPKRQQVINHSRGGVRPGQIVSFLLAQSVLSFEDLAGLDQ